MKYDGLTREQVDERDAKLKQEEANREARAYLAETDWYIMRNVETGAAIPEEILKNRAAARAAVKG
jgi:hypothetical protein